MDITATVRTFIVDNFLFGDARKLTSNNVSFLNTGIVDSTGVLELINFLEKTYGIKINDDELLPENLDSLENIEVFVKKKTGK